MGPLPLAASCDWTADPSQPQRTLRRAGCRSLHRHPALGVRIRSRTTSTSVERKTAPRAAEDDASRDTAGSIPVRGTKQPHDHDRVDVRPTPPTDAASDAELIRAVADGDAGALRELYARHAPWLGIRLRRRCNDPELVMDVLQDTFVAVWKGASKFRGDGDVAAWLWGIGIRRLISQLRGRKVSAEVLVADVESGASPAAEDAVLLGVEYGDVGSAMAALSPEFRAVIQATVLDGLSTKEAARLLGIPEGTVKTRAMRARGQLRAHLAGGNFAGGTLAGGTT